MTAKIHIGTSGWHYDHWRGPFYPEDFPTQEMLSFYSDIFDTVEINNSFYQTPKVEAIKNWRKTVPKGFIFAAKASRYITHNKKLKDAKKSLGNILPVLGKLGKSLGPILFQLPPRWHCNSDRLSEFLKALPKKRQFSIEFRDPTWHVPEVYELLKKHNVAFCIFQLGGFESPVEVTADFAYVRLHGPEGKYQGDYDTKTLTMWATQIREWRKKLKDIYVYFDNDQNGYAAKNARKLIELLKL